MLCKLLQLHCGRYHLCCENLGTRQNHQQNFPEHKETPIGHPRRPRSGLSGRGKRQKFSRTGESAGKALPGSNHFHCHARNTAQKSKLLTVRWKKPRKWNVAKDWYINNLSRSQVHVVHSFWVICRDISRTILELCMETPYLCTVLVHKYGRRKSTKTSGDHFFQ